MEKDRIEEAIIEEPEEVPRSSWVLVGQFFIVPVIIVALCVGIFLLFGLITHDSRTARDYLDEIKAGRGNRWQAAFELSKFLTANGEAQDQRLARDVSALFRSSKDDDPRIRQYLALALGRLHDPIGVPPLVESLAEANPDIQLYAAWALGELRDARAVEALSKLTEGQDTNVRKMAIFSLGLIQDPRAIPPLQTTLNDPHPDIRWNSALALARLGDRAGLDTLHQMIDRRYLNSLVDVRDEQKVDAIINAVKALALLKDSSARSQVQTLSKTDPDVKVRSAALDALRQIP